MLIADQCPYTPYRCSGTMRRDLSEHNERKYLDAKTACPRANIVIALLLHSKSSNQVVVDLITESSRWRMKERRRPFEFAILIISPCRIYVMELVPAHARSLYVKDNRYPCLEN